MTSLSRVTSALVTLLVTPLPSPSPSPSPSPTRDTSWLSYVSTAPRRARDPVDMWKTRKAATMRGDSYTCPAYYDMRPQPTGLWEARCPCGWTALPTALRQTQANGADHRDTCPYWTDRPCPIHPPGWH
jgi:hypothetical protein